MEAKRMEVAALLRALHTKSYIAEHLAVSQMTVHRVVKRLKGGEDLKDRPCSGKPQVVKRLTVKRVSERNSKLKMTVLVKRKKISVAQCLGPSRTRVERAYDAYKGPC